MLILDVNKIKIRFITSTLNEKYKCYRIDLISPIPLSLLEVQSNLLILIQERSTGRSRGFGYVTFASVDDAKVTFT